ncbi:NAD(P)-dependent oxidoreductase [uncultured Methylibium sp.]|uniref:NAD-dependent epimerase/dehydratase family protein n=1 Tax=uncultured Methylibium sp. TaxID=381093 RepID=UPI0025D0624F|nr:NAD(P)-dependent oxidoreductase [uncultured Methylibium sp.]
MSSPIAWVTGAHGFIGRHAARQLQALGYRVLGLGHGGWPADQAAAWGLSHWINGDVSSSNLHALQAIAGLPDCIVHLAGGSSVGAAVAHPREDFVRTVAGTVELLEWMRLESPASALVVVSSAAVYGAGHDDCITESAVLRPYSPYGHHKLMMEQLCRSYGAAYGLRSVVARLFSVYGPGLSKQLLWDLCSKLRSGPATIVLGGHGDEQRDWTHVRDVVAVLPRLAALADREVPTLNVGSGSGTSVRRIAELVLACWGGGTAPAALQFSGQGRPGDPRHLVADVGRLQRAGLACSSPVADGVAEYVAWFRNAAAD